MKDFLILAQAEGEPEVFESEQVDESAVEETTLQDGSAPLDPNATGGQATPPSPIMKFLPFILIFVIIYFFMFRGPRQKQKKHQQMVSSLEKNARVRTIGGIIGTIVEVKDKEVVLKIDESNNTKIKVLKGAIASTIADEENVSS